MKGKGQPRKRIGEPRAVYETQRRSAAKRTVLDWEWVEENRSWLEKQYAGRWIAVSKERIVGVGVKLSTAMKQAKKAGVPQPFVTAFKAAKYRGMAEVPLWF